MNWTAVIITFLVCATAISVTERLVRVAKIKLETMQAQRDIAYLNKGYQPPRRSR